MTLAGLIGRSEIPVLADIDGQLVRGLTETHFLDEEVSRPVAETDLPESIQTSRSFSRENRAALARTEQAAAQTGQAFGFLLPSVSLRANRGYEISEPSVAIDPVTGALEPYSRHIRTDVALTATQPLLDLPAFLEWRRRTAKEQAREESFRISDGDAYVATVETYLALVSTRLQADVMSEFETRLADLLSYIEKRANAGAASIADMSRVRARSQATQSSRLEQESAHLAAGSDFVRLTNLVPQKVRLPRLEDLGMAQLPASFDQAVPLAMRSNPELVTLTYELQAEKIDQTAAEGRFLPRFDAEYTDTYSDNAGGSGFSQRDKRAMLVMNWNLFSGGSDLRYRQERLSRYKELQYRMDDQRRRIIQALAANYAALATTRDRIASGYQELESISTAVEAMSQRMLSGNQSLLDLLDVYERHYQVRARLVNLHILEMELVAKLIRLTLGTPWPSPELPSSRPEESASPDWSAAQVQRNGA